MATGDHDWTAAEVVTAANVDDYLQLQTVEQFATAAARDAALSTRKREGMVTYQLDTNTLTVYSGAAWSTIGPAHGALLAWPAPPAVVQSVSVTVTVNYAVYQRVGRGVNWSIILTVTGTGTAANIITITLPVTAAQSSTSLIVGTGYINDNSANAVYPAVCAGASAGTKMSLLSTGISTAGAAAALNYEGNTGGVFTAGLAVNDIITASGWYEAAADA